MAGRMTAERCEHCNQSLPWVRFMVDFDTPSEWTAEKLMEAGMFGEKHHRGLYHAVMHCPCSQNYACGHGHKSEATAVKCAATLNRRGVVGPPRWRR